MNNIIKIGLANELLLGVTGTPSAMAMMHEIANEMEKQQYEWIKMLRASGVKAAHPDDGWVDRQQNYVRFAYPYFDDGVKTGDLIALGWPKYHLKKPQHRIVKVISCNNGKYFFEKV